MRRYVIKVLVAVVLCVAFVNVDENVSATETDETVERVNMSDPNVASSLSTFSSSSSSSNGNDTTVSSTNATQENAQINNQTKPSKIECISRNLTDRTVAVSIVNTTEMLSVVVPDTNVSANVCSLVLFYAPWCHFSALAAPHFNALARAFPGYHLFALNAITPNNVNTRFGVVAVPTLLLFQNARPVARFNDSVFSLTNFVTFIEKHTTSVPEGVPNVTSADFFGPLPSQPVQETDYVLWLAWTFILLCATFGFVKSSLCSRIVEIIRNNWREAEAQHEHGD